jgi:hypothetical protein
MDHYAPAESPPLGFFNDKEMKAEAEDYNKHSIEQ